MAYQIEMKKKNGEEIKKVLDISREFVLTFASECSLEDSEWIEERIAYWISKNGEKKYFAPFRTEFVKKFYPELLAKGGTNKPTALDKIKMINEAKRMIK